MPSREDWNRERLTIASSRNLIVEKTGTSRLAGALAK